MSSQQYLSGDLFSYTNGAYEFSVEFCVVNSSSFVLRFDGISNKDWREPKIGDTHGTPIYSRIDKSLSLGMPREGIPCIVFVHW